MIKKGFTLIELLAVIVILAIVALIATPTILGVIEKAKKGSAESSAYGYIDAVDKYLMTSSMSNNIEDGIYKASELNVEYKGKGPDNALITIENGSIKEGKICINNYSFDYDGTEVTSSVNNYCSENYKVTLVIDDQEEEKSIEKETSTTFELSDLTDKTNIVCNNGATPSLENNTLTISNIYGNTTCYINSSLEDTINDLDSTLNSIIMISNEEKTQALSINEGKNVVLNLNGKTIKTYNPDDIEESSTTANDEYASFIIYGNLTINDFENQGWITTTKSANNIFVEQSGSVVINGGNYTGYRAVVIHGSLIINDGNYYSKYNDVINQSNNSKVTINGGYFKQENSTLYYAYSGTLEINSGIFESNKVVINNASTAIVTINGGNFISTNSYALYNYKNSDIYVHSGYIYSENSTTIVNYSDGNIYIDNSLGNVFISHGNVGTSVWNNKSIVNKSSGNIYINGVNGNDNICSNEYNESSIGICIVGNDRAILNESSATGSIYINQANVVNYAEVYAVNNYIGNIYINNSNITSTNSSAIVNNDGNVFICNSKITSKNYDLVNSSTGTGTINYSSDTIFTSGTNTPKISNPNGTINVDYTGTCLSN